MAPSFLRTALSAAAFASSAFAVTSIPDANMTSWLNDGAVELAVSYAPIWFFGQMDSNLPCIPTWAFGGSPNTSDVYDTAHQTPAAKQCDYPNVGCGCRNPGVPKGNPAPPFPVYYTFSQCNATEVRVAYNLFYQKDGAKVLGIINTGHDYDWERIIIVHTKDTANNSWAPSTALYSAHSGYNKYAWGDIQNTLTTDQVNAGDAKDPNGVQNEDHPKAYVGWSKHPHFDDRNTGFHDPASQSLGNAYRSDDWWYYVDPKYYIRSDNTTDAGKALGAANWGTGATSNPPKVQASLCTEGN